MSEQPKIEGDPAAAAQLAQWLTGKWISHALHAVAKLSIADLLQEGEKSVSELAQSTGTHGPSLYRLLRALASVGVFRESAPQRFQSTSMGDLLRAGVMRGGCLMMHSEWHDKAWAHLLESVQTGQSAFVRAHGAPLFDWLGEHPGAAEVFNDAMTAGKTYRDQGVADLYDFARFRRIVDVGGGHGALLFSILRRHPHLEGVVFDLPEVAAGARLAAKNAGLADRCQVLPGNFFESVPEGGDVYILAHVMHDWDDDACRRILQNCRESMKGRNARILLLESPVSGANQPDRTKWLDLEMLVLTEGGRERTEEEYRDLLASSGFHLTRVISPGGGRSIMEAFVSGVLR